MVLQTLGKWSQIKGMSSPAAAGGDEEIALQTVKFLPYPVRLSSEAHLWADQRAETSTKEDIQRVQINPSAAPATPRTSIPTLISMNSLTSSYASIPIGFPPICFLYPSTHQTTSALLLLPPEPDKAVLALPLTSATPDITRLDLSRKGFTWWHTKKQTFLPMPTSFVYFSFKELYLFCFHEIHWSLSLKIILILKKAFNYLLCRVAQCFQKYQMIKERSKQIKEHSWSMST